MGNEPSITLPSRQLPGLLCFGALFFNLMLFSLPSFLVAATLIVDSSSLPTEADRVRYELASLLQGIMSVTQGYNLPLFTAPVAMVA